MKWSRRELSIDAVIHRGIFKGNQMTLLPCFTFVPKTGVSFYCEQITFKKDTKVCKYSQTGRYFSTSKLSI